MTATLTPYGGVRTDATRHAPWGTAALLIGSSRVHRVTSVRFYWRDGRIAVRYVASACGRVLVNGLLHADHPRALAPCRACDEAVAQRAQRAQHIAGLLRS